MKEETLSDKIYELSEGLALHPDDVKNSIKKLKGKFCLNGYGKGCKDCDCCKEIDKIFGEELSK